MTCRQCFSLGDTQYTDYKAELFLSAINNAKAVVVAVAVAVATPNRTR